MDLLLINVKHIQLWLSTQEIGIGVIYVFQNKSLIITLGLLQLIIWFKEVDE